MRRIIDRQIFDGKKIPDEFTLAVLELGNGQREAVISQAIAWEHVGTQTPDEAAYLLEKYGPADAEAKALANAERAARRAKTRVRRLVKSMGCDSLLTLTYRANQTQQSLAVYHLQEFVRRIRKVIPGFAYVAAFETQKRGAWHIHLAVHALPRQLAHPVSGVKVKSWSIVRAIWRSVTGELGGNIDERKRSARSRWSVAKLAGYLSKYMTKAFADGDAWSNRFSASKHSIPEAARVTFRGVSLADVIAAAYAFAADGACSVQCSWLSRYGDLFYLASEPPALDRSIHCR